MGSYSGQWIFWDGLWHGVIAESTGDRLSCGGVDFIRDITSYDAAICLGKNPIDPADWRMDWGCIGGGLFRHVDLI